MFGHWKTLVFSFSTNHRVWELIGKFKELKIRYFFHSRLPSSAQVCDVFWKDIIVIESFEFQKSNTPVIFWYQMYKLKVGNYVSSSCEKSWYFCSSIMFCFFVAPFPHFLWKYQFFYTAPPTDAFMVASQIVNSAIDNGVMRTICPPRDSFQGALFQKKSWLHL